MSSEFKSPLLIVVKILSDYCASLNTKCGVLGDQTYFWLAWLLVFKAGLAPGFAFVAIIRGLIPV